MSTQAKARRATARTRTATHRPAARRRRFRHDDLVAVDLFSGFGGLTQGIKQAGFTTIMAANHNSYKVEVHEANHPDAEHWIADLVDPDSADYHSARDLPAADLLVAGVSCVNHSQANTQKAYEQGLSLFDLDDPDFDARVTRSERDRATANCVLHYAARHHPRLILIECTTELTSWGPALPGRPKVGDGTTFKWWLKQFTNLGYRHRVLYLNSMFFGVPQSRDRLYIAFWDRHLPTPDLAHRPEARCPRCDRAVQAVWSWKTGVPASGSVRYGTQYHYTCPSCRGPVVPPMTPSLAALDLSNLGTRIGDKPIKKQRDGSIGPLAAATMARAERCRRRFAEFPAVLMPAKAVHGTEKHLWQPLATQTSQQETAILTTGTVLAAHRIVSAGIVPFRQNTIPTVHAEAMPTVTSDQIPGLLTATGAPQPAAAWQTMLAEIPLLDCFFRMMSAPEIGVGCGFDVTRPGHPGSFQVWGSARDQTDGFGNAVSPAVGAWIGQRLRAILTAPEAITHQGRTAAEGGEQ
ncbi:DNA cytosine methyltransferase [Amycolatopsis ultiminotia]|uniref:DNA (cytosine-5-)-methyltransferase n=1 Tax=Amycolatopsis ultiminotia TaxID=543629 RepID=A0ABP6VMA0_9PSEU